MSKLISKLIFPSIPPFQTLTHKIKNYSLSFPENSKVTKQSFAAECDINTIMARYQSTGQMPVLNDRAPQYLDMPGYDFQEAMNLVLDAQALFADLPSALRSRFGNDPAQFLDFTSNPQNRAELQSLGLLKTPPPGQQAALAGGATVVATGGEDPKNA